MYVPTRKEQNLTFVYCYKTQPAFENTKKVKKTKAIIIQTDHDRLEFLSSVESARWMKLQKIVGQLNQALLKSFS